MAYRIGLDVGGTFTGVVAVDEESGEYGSTTVIPRDMKALVDAYDNVIIEG